MQGCMSGNDTAGEGRVRGGCCLLYLPACMTASCFVPSSLDHWGLLGTMLVSICHCFHGLCCLLCRTLLACAAGCFVCYYC